MALAALKALVKHRVDLDITWIINARNNRLQAELVAASCAYQALTLDHPFNALRPSFAAVQQIVSVARTFRRLAPNLIVILQGGIIASFGGVLAAHLSGQRFCSYIAMAQRSTELASYRLPRIWNAARSLYYRSISHFITIDNAQAANIRREHRRATISVVENYISLPPRGAALKNEVRARLHLPVDATVIGVIGRIEFAQKAQDWLITGLGGDPILKSKLLLFVGEGPDAPRLRELLRSAFYADRMRMIGWCENMEEIYMAIDLVLIASRVEGVPLVMLEALSRRIPVVGTDRDGMASWLPRQWRFPFGRVAEMKRAINSAITLDTPSEWARIEAHLKRVTDERRFAQEFGDALTRYCDPACKLTDTQSDES